MKKSDLKTGMVVELRNEDKYLVMNDSILNLDGWDKMSNYENDLTSRAFDSLDILKVYETSGGSFKNMFLISNLTLIWEREENTPVDKLIKLFGDDCRCKNKTNECDEFDSCSNSSKSESSPFPSVILFKIPIIRFVPSRQGVHFPHDSSHVKSK